MRISTRSIMSGYNRNLNKTLNNLYASQTTVLTQRNFNSIAEDPASASRSFKLWREYNQNADYIENAKTTQELFDSVASSTLQVSKILSEQVNADALQAVNGATSYEARQTYATTLRGMQESIVLSMNASYGDRFLFGGASTKEAPFELTDKGVLTYRGVNVNTTDPAEIKKLEGFMKETLYVDLGFGMQETAGVIDDDSVFNTAISGIEVLGYGQTDDGVSENIVTLLGQMADELEKEPLDEEKYNQLFQQFTDLKNDVADFAAELGTDCEFLENTVTKLENNQDTLNKQIISLDQADMPAAITNYIWQEYAYNAALKVGNSLLSQSFIDFMK